MKWEHICQDPDSVTEAMDVSTGVIVRVWSLENDTVSMVFVSDSKIEASNCGERTNIVRRTQRGFGGGR